MSGELTPTVVADALHDQAERLAVKDFEISRLQQELAEARAWRDQFDCCMCGSTMDSHDIGSGHAPVSVYDYTMNQLKERAKAAEAREKQAQAEKPGSE